MNTHCRYSSPSQRLTWRAIHWFAWIAVSTYAMWVYATCEDTTLPQKLPYQFRYSDGRSPYFGKTRKWDLSDREWRNARHFIVTTWPWLVLHSVVGRAVAHAVPSLLPHYHAAFSVAFVSLKLTWFSAACYLAQHAVFFALAWMKVPALCYGVALILVSLYDLFQLDLLNVVYESHGYYCYFMSVVAFYWTVLRCFSFCMDYMSSDKENAGSTGWPEYWKTLAYVVYLPPLFLGPLQNYDDFIKSMERPKPPITVREIINYAAGLLRSAAHILLIDIMCHYFYSSALITAPHLVKRLDNTSLLGYGVIINIMFFLKYLIQYGFSGNCARIEGLRLPSPPKCVARSHLCSHFWRYIYLPIVGPERKAGWRMIAVATSFGCVWVWHSMTTAVTFWATLSFVGIALEVVLDEVRRLNCCKRLESKYMNTASSRFLKAAIGSPHYLLTIFACMFYLTTIEVTTIFFKRVILGFPIRTLHQNCDRTVFADVLKNNENHPPASCSRPRNGRCCK
uniref:Uncharacterized protein n=1 Tax=Amblyomma maculatum TaxID=34609 RepID=G3MSZ3_AMBMU